MKLEDALYKAYTGKSHAREPKTVRGQLNAMARATGAKVPKHQNQRLAARLGVHVDTVRKWRTGKQRATKHIPTIKGAYRATQVKGSPDPRRIRIHGTAWMMGNPDYEENRNLHLGGWGTWKNSNVPELMDEAWRRGDDRTAAFLISDAIDREIDGTRLIDTDWVEL